MDPAGVGGGPSTVTDVFQGQLGDLWVDRGFTRAICRANGQVGVSFPDDWPVAGPWGSLWYLVRAENDCGASELGASSTAPRSLPPTPCN